MQRSNLASLTLPCKFWPHLSVLSSVQCVRSLLVLLASLESLGQHVSSLLNAKSAQQFTVPCRQCCAWQLTHEFAKLHAHQEQHLSCTTRCKRAARQPCPTALALRGCSGRQSLQCKSSLSSRPSSVAMLPHCSISGSASMLHADNLILLCLRNYKAIRQAEAGDINL